MSRSTTARREAGFTLIELLIVVIILGILAAAVIPLFGEQSSKAKVATLKTDLSTVRTQISLYKVEHDGLPIGVVRNPAGATTTACITQTDGTVSATLWDPAAYRAGTLAAGDLGISSASTLHNIHRQLLGTTSRDGRSDGTLTYGPYLQKMPANPFITAATRAIRMKWLATGSVDRTAASTATDCGYHYSPYTLEVVATGAVTPMPSSEVEAGNNTLQDL